MTANKGRTQAQQAVDAFNAKHTLGVRCAVRRDNGDSMSTFTTTLAYVSASGHAVIHLAHVRGSYLLDRVTAEPDAIDDEAYIEAAYWRFDAKHKGYGRWKDAPMSERDAFKDEMRQLVARIRDVIATTPAQAPVIDEIAVP